MDEGRYNMRCCSRWWLYDCIDGKLLWCECLTTQNEKLAISVLFI